MTNPTPTNGERNITTLNWLRRLAESRFFGTIVLKFENGVAVHIREERNYKPDDLPSEPSNPSRGNHATTTQS